MSDLEQAAKTATDNALAVVKDRFESDDYPKHMHYHNRVHTQGVVTQARAIGEAMGMNERQILLTTIAAAYHDVVQHWSPVEKDGGVVSRVRKAGLNEIASAHEALTAMGDLGVGFSPEEQGIVASAIVATIPGWDPEHMTVSQPLLNGNPVVTAVALADLSAAGTDPEMYRRDGPALFAEENLDVMKAVLGAQKASEISDETQDKYRARYAGWLGIQPGFANGRRNRMQAKEINSFDTATQGKIMEVFSRFDESIAIAEQAAARAKEVDFVTLMRTLDPKAFPGE